MILDSLLRQAQHGSLTPKAIKLLEGTLLLATYLVLGFAFYFHPVIPVPG